jgi:hydroxymethylpyrimidine pyrophosphatase-like HAD family hydrolase
MRYRCLACDYDGTIAHHGRVGPATVAALERLRSLGCRLVLVTGRELDELIPLFPELPLFDLVVAENGALLYYPASGQERLLGERPPAEFIAALHDREVKPLAVGRVILAAWEPSAPAILKAIQEFGLELQIIFNKGSVMVLPAGVNKATGLTAALKELNLNAQDVVGVGDAENDHAFLALCGAAVAVANALPAIKERADLVTRGEHGTGVVELIELMMADELAAPKTNHESTEEGKHEHQHSVCSRAFLLSCFRDGGFGKSGRPGDE